MTDIYCEWNGDFILTPNGDIQTAVGWDEVRQRIVRRLITNSAQVLPDGTTTAPDYVFHPTYGIGAGALVGQNPTPAYISGLIARINAAVLADDAVDPGTTPTIVFSQPTTNVWLVQVAVQLTNGKFGQVALRIQP